MNLSDYEFNWIKMEWNRNRNQLDIFKHERPIQGFQSY